MKVIEIDKTPDILDEMPWEIANTYHFSFDYRYFWGDLNETT